MAIGAAKHDVLRFVHRLDAFVALQCSRRFWRPLRAWVWSIQLRGGKATRATVGCDRNGNRRAVSGGGEYLGRVGNAR